MSDMIIPVSMDLTTFEVASCDLSQEYWTPSDVGEKRRMVFVKVTDRTVLDQKTSDEILLPCVVFIQPINGESKTVVNGSKRLVAVFENSSMEPGTPFEITYKGKKKNRTNGNMSDDWSVVKLTAAKAKK